MRPYDVRDCVNQSHPDPSPDRAPGVHVSDLVERLATKLGHLDPRPWDTASTLRARIGTAWESHLGPLLERKLPCFVWQPGELTLDGITGTPDGLEHSLEGRIVLHEIKFTWISVNNRQHGKRPGLVTWYWEAQIKAYCKMANTRWAVLHRLYCNRTYKPPEPYYWPLGIEFTQLELDRHWRMLLGERDKLLKESA